MSDGYATSPIGDLVSTRVSFPSWSHPDVT